MADSGPRGRNRADVALPLLAGYLAHMPGQPSSLQCPPIIVLPGLSDYPDTIAAMEWHVDQTATGKADEEIWFVEHPALISAGTSSVASELLDETRFPVFQTGRGGRHTYHGPGQRVVYPILDLASRGRDLRRYVAALEYWAISALADFGVKAFPSQIGTGIWVAGLDGPSKIGAIGVRVRRWISFHGLAINVSTDLAHFGAIVPCGIKAHGVARLVDLAPGTTMADLDEALVRRLPEMMHYLSGRDSPPIKTLEAQCDCR